MNQVERTSMQVVGPAPSPAIAYPLHPEQLPSGVCSAGRYQLRFARSRDDLRAIQRLRFEVFNLELDEGLDEAFLLGRDEDHFDAHCHHLMVLERESGVVVGTYRFMTAELAKSRGGFYSETEFDFTRMPPEILASGAEIGRACVHADHRSGRVIHLLWRGIARYLAWNQKRFLFGCASVPSTDPAVAFMLRDALRA
ncbi:MAG: GNAT family N-acetyltransferase, partial [Myxococcota bacterium]